MKILYILNTAKKVNNFSYTSMIAAQKVGLEFQIAGNWSYENDKEKREDEIKYGIKIHQVDFVRNPFDFKNIRAYRQVTEIIKKEKIEIIHCNTPNWRSGRAFSRKKMWNKKSNLSGSWISLL